MTRILEFIVALVIVIALAVGIGVALPAHGHIERSIEVVHLSRHIDDLLSNFRRFNEWGSLRALDPKIQYTLDGPAFGQGAKLLWKSNEAKIGEGSYVVADPATASVKAEGDRRVVLWNVENNWSGTNKTFTIQMEPSTKNPRLVKITWAYDVDFGWDLVARYSGLYLHGDPATQILTNLQNLQSILATIPNVPYDSTDIYVAEVASKPSLVVPTQAPRALDEVAAATDKAMSDIGAVMKKLNLKQVGPRQTITNEWGDENYVFDVSVPIDATTIKIDNKEHVITAPQPVALDDDAAPVEPKPGELDKKGNLVVTPTVRARTSYGGKALFTTWIGSPAGLPLMRLNLKAYGMTHGFHFNDSINHYFDEMLTDPNKVADDNQQFVVYLPVLDNVAATGTPPSEPLNATAGGQH